MVLSQEHFIPYSLVVNESDMSWPRKGLPYPESEYKMSHLPPNTNISSKITGKNFLWKEFAFALSIHLTLWFFFYFFNFLCDYNIAFTTKAQGPFLYFCLLSRGTIPTANPGSISRVLSPPSPPPPLSPSSRSRSHTQFNWNTGSGSRRIVFCPFVEGNKKP